MTIQPNPWASGCRLLLLPHAVWARTLRGRFQPRRLLHEDRRVHPGRHPPLVALSPGDESEAAPRAVRVAHVCLAATVGAFADAPVRILVPVVVEPPLLPWLHQPLPHRHLQPPLPAPPPHFAKAAELPQGLWEQALAVSTLAVAGPLAHHEAQEGP